MASDRLLVRYFLADRWPCCCEAVGVALGSVEALWVSVRGSGEEGRRRAGSTGGRFWGLVEKWLAWVAISRATPSADSGRFFPVAGAAGLSGANSEWNALEDPLRFPGVELKTE